MTACPECHAPNATSARFCGSCGAALPARCETCSTELSSSARFCSWCGAPVSRSRAQDDSLKVVTVLFADVVGFTELSHRLEPEDLRDTMTHYFEAMSEEIRAQGGTVEKFIGDAVMAVFGVPTAHEDDPRRAARAAVNMIERLGQRNAGAPDGARLNIRVGINTGDVLAAGAADRDLMVTGEAVNVASRLQQVAAPNTIVVGDRTARALGDVVRLAPLGPRELKGLSTPIAVWQVASVVDEDHPRARAPLPIVGRTKHMQQLQDLFARAEGESEPELVTVIGEAGVGKTRLLRELSDSLSSRVRHVSGRCLPYGRGVTLWPLGEILKAEAGVLESEPPAEVVGKLTKLVDAIDVSSGEEAERVARALATTIGIDIGGAPRQGADPRRVYRDMLWAWRLLLASWAAERPLIVLFEDVHWADPLMLDIIEELQAEVTGPILFCCAARPELLTSRPGWDRQTGRRNLVWLEPLDATEGAVMLSSLLATKTAPDELRKRILERAGGNPFFLEELVHQLEQEGTLSTPEARANIELPDNVHAVILARLDLLTPSERLVLRQAAVAGKDFGGEAVRHLCSLPDISEILDSLERRDFVVKRRTPAEAGQIEYSFKHILIRDVAYRSLPKRERGRAHAVLAQLFESANPERTDELAEVLSHHFRRAYEFLGNDSFKDKARGYCLIAARIALKRFAIESAESLGKTAVELSSEAAKKVEALEELGNLYHLSFRGDGAWSVYTQALRELEQSDSGDRGATARLAAKAAIISTRFWGTMNQPPLPNEVDAMIKTGLDSVESAGSREASLLLASKAFSQIMGYTERTPEGEEAAGKALTIAEALGDADVISSALDANSCWLLLDGLYREIDRINKRRVELVPLLSDVSEISDAHAMAAWSSFHIGRYPESVAHATHCVDKARNVDAGSYLYGLAWRVCARFMTGDWDGALADHSEVERLTHQSESGLPVPFSVRSYAYAMLALHLRGETAAQEECMRVLRRFQTDDRLASSLAGSLPVMARALAHQGASDEAKALLSTERNDYLGIHLEALCDVTLMLKEWDQAEEVVRRCRAESELAGLVALNHFADRLEGACALQRGEHVRAIAKLSDAALGFAGLGAAWEEAWSRLLLAAGQHAAGAGDEARFNLQAASNVFARLGSIRELERARGQLD